MSRRFFNQEQISELLKNKNVTKCSAKSIGYSDDFKVLAVNQWNAGFPVSDIFRQAGFVLEIIGEDTPPRCLRRWRKTFKIKGELGLRMDGRGKTKGLNQGRPRIRNLADADKIKRLEATVAYLRAENDFLTKLRSGQAE